MRVWAAAVAAIPGGVQGHAANSAALANFRTQVGALAEACDQLTSERIEQAEQAAIGLGQDAVVSVRGSSATCAWKASGCTIPRPLHQRAWAASHCTVVPDGLAHCCSRTCAFLGLLLALVVGVVIGRYLVL